MKKMTKKYLVIGLIILLVCASVYVVASTFITNNGEEVLTETQMEDMKRKEKIDNDIVIEYSYAYADDCSYTVTKTINGVIDPDGNLSDIRVIASYDSLGQKVYETDGEGNTTEYMYNAMGNVIKQTNPDETYKQIVYDIPNNDITITDENGNATTKAYNPIGLLEKVYYDNNPYNTLYEYEYDNNGNMLT